MCPSCTRQPDLFNPKCAKLPQQELKLLRSVQPFYFAFSSPDQKPYQNIDIIQRRIINKELDFLQFRYQLFFFWRFLKQSHISFASKIDPQIAQSLVNHSQLVYHMSVKDKIAMWNSMGANNSNNPPPPAPKYSSTFVPKPSVAETAATGHLSAKPAELNKTPSNTEKKWEVDTGSIKTAPWVKSQESGLKPAPVVASKPVVVPASTGESEKILKPSEIKKKLESMSAGKGLYFAAPPQPAPRIQKATNPAVSTTYEVEKGPIAVNVKQNAEKLNQFYQKQHMLQARKVEEAAKEPAEVEKPTEEHKHEKHEQTAHQQSHKEVHHETQPLFKHTESHTHEPESKKEETKHTQHPHLAEPTIGHTATIESKPQAPQETASENKPDEMSLATRIKRRKMKQASFDSDDD